MTSPLRRKHQITVPKYLPEKTATDPRDGAGNPLPLRHPNSPQAKSFVCLAITILLPVAAMADSPPAKLNPPANAKSIWIPRHTVQRTYTPQSSARPHGEETVERTPSGAILKWRAKGASAFQHANTPRSRPAAVRTAGGDASSGQVRRAAQLEPIDPFQDPFGDSVVQNDGGQFQTEPRPAQPIPDVTPPIAPEFDPSGIDEPPMLEIPKSEPPELAPASDLPAPSRKPCPDDQPCDKPYKAQPSDVVHNERNCCEVEHNCRCIRDEVGSHTIDRIALDVTPLVKPEAETAEERETARRERLAKMPSRVWHNRRGEQVASGKVINFRNRRAIIEGSNGQTVQIPFNEMGREEICFLTAWWELPAECILSDDRRNLDEGREEWIAATYTWTASALCHKPLYFEDRALERYGHTTGPIVQPFKSGAHFFLNIAFLPYHMGMYPPNECRYALGYYRPGDCAPWMVDPIPFSLRGALFQAGAAVGVAAVIP